MLPRTTGELLRDLVSAHVGEDESRFLEAALHLIQEERRKNHHVLASDLERLLSDGDRSRSSIGALTPFRRFSDDLPKDSERGLNLVEVFEPHRTPDSLVLSEDLRQRIDRIVAEQRDSDVLKAYGLEPARRLLFYGPPGCGKTACAETLATQLDLPLFVVRFDAVVSSYLGETASNLGRVFDWASKRPAVLLFDEFDAIGRRRDDDQEHGELKRVVNSFLQMLDSFRTNGLVIAATNHESLLDNAVWRRFDEALVFDRPVGRQYETLLRLILARFPVAPRFPFASTSRMLQGFTHADVERACFSAAKSMVLNGHASLRVEVLKSEIIVQRNRMESTYGSDG